VTTERGADEKEWKKGDKEKRRQYTKLAVVGCSGQSPQGVIQELLPSAAGGREIFGG
jgi:hypothetical protein